jgi:hypothetical protein
MVFLCRGDDFGMTTSHGDLAMRHFPANVVDRFAVPIHGSGTDRKSLCAQDRLPRWNRWAALRLGAA